MNRYLIGAYWPPRADDVELCVGRVQSIVEYLRGVHPLFSHWCDDIAGVTTEVPNQIRDLIRQKLESSAAEAKADPELGFSLHLWNGCSHPNGVVIAAQLSSTLHVPPLGNHFLIQLFTDDGASSALWREDVLVKLLQHLTDAWDAYWATAYPTAIHQKLDRPGLTPFLGWITVLRHAPLSGLPAYKVMPIGRGSIVISTQEPLNPEEPSHIQTLEQLYRELDAKNLLGVW